ncbi:Pentachlorophenol 4-monooxygenase [Arthrobacter sp. SO5]|uniref:FAD-dependent oxidoreductase n=1 Tax=Arthrobacter sp. SO5 TaxID=1897055 RepID=UPI001E35EAED|nr:FAD-dependent oxidoreductase [Arthrobacter sp. SO5]MCB5275531.1 Pentachlorophenol 4-monooxygenase [Arthrobacter sp. SO5]
MQAKTDVLIVGAGPTGLSAALFLLDQGHRVRLIDRRSEPSSFSKAFGVNARTLDLLSASGVSESFIANGRKLERINIRRRGKVLGTLQLDDVADEYPFLCVQSQADSERILTEAVQERSGVVERGVELTNLEQGDAGVEVTTRSSSGEQVILASTVFGADGATSTVRNLLGVDFEGTTYPEPWQLFDVELETPLPPDEANIFLLADGGMFVVRHAGNLWRVLGSGADLLGALPAGTKIGPVHWESSFQVSNRVAAKFSHGRVHLGGDAAHTHAGIGARGMNLGIEDAFVFATLFDQGRLKDYEHLRRPIVQKVVREITRMMMVPRSQTLPGRIVRAVPAIVGVVLPLARTRIQPWLLGLDHEIHLRH